MIEVGDIVVQTEWFLGTVGDTLDFFPRGHGVVVNTNDNNEYPKSDTVKVYWPDQGEFERGEHFRWYRKDFLRVIIDKSDQT